MTAPASPDTVAEEQYTTQLALTAALLYEVTQLWQAASLASPELWLQAMVELISSTAREIAEALVTFYDDYRRATVGTGLDEDVLPENGFDSIRDLATSVTVPPEQVRRAMTYLGPVNARYRTEKGWTEQAVSDTGLVDVQGAAARLAQEPAREVVPRIAEMDRFAVGYRRVTAANPCHFCAMLATRGAMIFGQPAFFYESRETAGGRNATSVRNPRGVRRFVGDGDYKFHDNCRCTVVPVFSGDEPLREQERAFLDLYRESTAAYSGAAKLRAFRRAFNAAYPSAPR